MLILRTVIFNHHIFNRLRNIIICSPHDQFLTPVHLISSHGRRHSYSFRSHDGCFVKYCFSLWCYLIRKFSSLCRKPKNQDPLYMGSCSTSIILVVYLNLSCLIMFLGWKTLRLILWLSQLSPLQTFSPV